MTIYKFKNGLFTITLCFPHAELTSFQSLIFDFFERYSREEITRSDREHLANILNIQVDGCWIIVSTGDEEFLAALVQNQEERLGVGSEQRLNETLARLEQSLAQSQGGNLPQMYISLRTYFEISRNQGYPSNLVELRLYYSIKDYIKQDSKADTIYRLLAFQSQKLKECRRPFLDSMIHHNRQSSKSEAVELFEEELLRIGHMLSASLNLRNFDEVPEDMFQGCYWSLLDSDSKRMLTSYRILLQILSPVYQANEDNLLLPLMDLSSVGCLLWKAYERELNITFLTPIRMKYSLTRGFDRPIEALTIDVNNPYNQKTGNNTSDKVNINQRNRTAPTLFSGHELGKILYLIKNERYNDVSSIMCRWQEVVRNQISPKISWHNCRDKLVGHIYDVKDIRNNFSHIVSMSRTDLDNLNNTLLGRVARPCGIEQRLNPFEFLMLLKSVMIQTSID